LNKKIITILLIISILSTGLTAIAAQDSNLSTADVATENTEQTNDNADVATQAAVNDSANNTNESENNTNITDNQTKKSEINKLYEMLSSFDDKQYAQLLGLLKEMDEEDYVEFSKYLNSNNRTEEGLYDVLNNLSDDEYYTLYIMLHNINSNKSESTITGDQISKLPQRTQKAIERTSNEQLKQAVSNNNNHNIFNNGHQTYKLTLADKYMLLDDLIEGYLLTIISFDEFKEAAHNLGFDTSNLVLNPDGSISWDGLTIPSPSAETDNTSQNSTATNTTNDTANNTADNTSSDNTQSQDTQQQNTGDVEKTETQQPSIASASSQ